VIAGVLARLRDETRDEHEAIEAALDWRARASDAASYRHWIARLHGFHRGWEPAVAAALADPAFFDPRRKLHLLADDLARLGGCAAPAAPVAAFATPAEALGSMYVIEGSTLGGQLIARHVRATLGFEPTYHASYGPAAGRMWRGFRARIERDVPAADADVAVASAARTFAHLRDWLTRGEG
jgi:heme oxygenase